jgi:plasmid stabilization system protein ParE
VAFEVVRSRASDRDLALIFDHLVESYRSVGEDEREAVERAATRMTAIEDAVEALGATPFQGTLMPALMPGLRRVTKDRAIFHFTVDEAQERVVVLVIFFGGQDHQRRMLSRLAGGEA